MLTITSSSKRSVNMLFIGCFLAVFWVIFKDAFRISLFFPIPDIGIVVFIISVLVTFVAFLQGSRYITLSLVDVIILAYIFYSSIVTVAHSVLHNPYEMSSYKILIVFTLQCLSMFMLWFFSTKSPATLVKVTNSVANFALFSCVLLGVILLFFVIIDLNSVFQFYKELVDLGVIVYPFQTSDEGIAVRYSGIFYSALNFGMFLIFSIVLLFCGGIKGAQKNNFVCFDFTFSFYFKSKCFHHLRLHKYSDIPRASGRAKNYRLFDDALRVELNHITTYFHCKS